jgi:hypothetical protein
MNIFGAEIKGLTPPVLMELADHIDEFARQLRLTANENENRLTTRRNHANHFRSVKAATRYFSELIEAGKSTEYALNEAAFKYCVSKDAVSMNVTFYKAKQRKLEKAKKERRVMQLWRAGYPLNMVSKESGVHIRTVNRILQEYRNI